MKLKYEFVVQEVGDTYLAIVTGKDAEAFPGMLRMNRESKAVFDLLRNETTREKIEEDLNEMFSGVKPEQIDETITKFREAGIID